MKKIILILIFILCFTLVGECNWLTGWDQRIKLTIDNTKIDAALTWFPVTVFLTSTAGEEVFTEFDADADYIKVAFTKADGLNQLYADCEKFDDSAQIGIYHVSLDGWEISSSADTIFYMYYDNDHADNTTYISYSGATAAQSVYDANFKAVYHMHDDTTSTILDSTSNNNDGTKKDANEPIEATGQVGQGQDFDGTDDYIDIGTLGTLGSLIGTKELTIFEGLVKSSETDAAVNVMGTANTGSTTVIQIQLNIDKDSGVSAGRIRVYIRDEDAVSTGGAVQTDTGITDGSWHYLVVNVDGLNGVIRVYLDSALQSFTYLTEGPSDNVANFEFPMYIGALNNRGTASSVIDGVVDGVRFNDDVRAAAWIKATYNSLFNTLLTYGSEETSGNVIMFGTNF